jgi:hypothetical protein
MKRRLYAGLVGMTMLSGCSAITGGDFSNDEVGQTYSTDDSIDLTLDQVETQQGARVWFGEESPITGQSDRIQFVLLHLVATNTTESAIAMPSADDFSLMVGDSQHDPLQVKYAELIDGIESPLTDPVSGPLFPPGDEIGPDEELAGWFVFTIPTNASTVVLELRRNDDIELDWSVTL